MRRLELANAQETSFLRDPHRHARMLPSALYFALGPFLGSRGGPQAPRASYRLVCGFTVSTTFRITFLLIRWGIAAHRKRSNGVACGPDTASVFRVTVGRSPVYCFHAIAIRMTH